MSKTMFKFPNVPVDQLTQRNVLTEGIYPFRVETSEHKVANTGNEMIALKIIVTTPEGKEVPVWDNLMLMETMAWKCHHFCCTIEHEELYTQGELNANGFVGMGGQVLIYTNKKNKDRNIKMELPKSEWRNAVKDYIKPEDLANVTSEAAPAIDPSFNDTLPF